MRDVRIGLCGWTIGMREYVERFPVVEVQQTFYEPPSRATLANWRALAPPGFEFTLKAWQLITHDATIPTYRRLRTPLSDVEKRDAGSFRWTPITRRAWEKTVECARILGATRVLLQCPPSFKPTTENLDRMRRFCSEITRDGLTLMWEPRGGWKREIVQRLCDELRLVHVVDPFVDETVTPGHTYFRLHGISGARHVYSDTELRKLKAMLPDNGVCWVLFNNIPREGDAERFRRLLVERGAKAG